MFFEVIIAMFSSQINIFFFLLYTLFDLRRLCSSLCSLFTVYTYDLIFSEAEAMFLSFKQVNK